MYETLDDIADALDTYFEGAFGVDTTFDAIDEARDYLTAKCADFGKYINGTPDTWNDFVAESLRQGHDYREYITRGATPREDIALMNREQAELLQLYTDLDNFDQAARQCFITKVAVLANAAKTRDEFEEYADGFDKEYSPKYAAFKTKAAAIIRSLAIYDDHDWQSTIETLEKK